MTVTRTDTRLVCYGSSGLSSPGAPPYNLMQNPYQQPPQYGQDYEQSRVLYPGASSHFPMKHAKPSIDGCYYDVYFRLEAKRVVFPCAPASGSEGIGEQAVPRELVRGMELKINR